MEAMLVTTLLRHAPRTRSPLPGGRGPGRWASQRALCARLLDTRPPGHVAPKASLGSASSPCSSTLPRALFLCGSLHLPFPLLTLLITVLLFLSPTALAQSDINVSAQLEKSSVFVDEAVVLSIIVEGSNSPERPALRLPDGVVGEFLGGQDSSTRFTSIVNGVRDERISRQYIFRYQLTPTREGVFTIPGAEVAINGRTYTTEPVRLAARQPEQSSEFALRVEVDRDTLYVGEPARLRIVWSLGADVKSVSAARMEGIDAFELATPRDRVPAGRSRDPDAPVELTMFGRTVVGTRGSETVDGRRITTFTFEQVITPREAGVHELGPMSLTFDAVTGQRPRTFWDFPGDDRSLTRRMSVRSRPITITVNPLPEDGRPADFTGLVGDYTLSASAEPLSVSVGDPITLRLIADGPDPTSRVEAPDLSRYPAFDGFRLSSEGWRVDSGDLPGPRAFSTTLRVADAAVTEIPAIEIPYFDPSDERYKRARSEPIPLNVRATREVTAADALGGSFAISARPATSLDSAGPGFVANATGAWVLADEGGGLFDTVRSPLVATVLVAPPLAFFGALAVRALGRRSDAHGARVARARREAAAAIRKGPAEGPIIAAALRRYAGAVLNINPDAVTPFDCAPAGLARVGAVLSDCDAGRFGDGADSASKLAARALAALEDARSSRHDGGAA